MNCPACGRALVQHIAHSVELDECPNCHGLWFDKGELRKARDETEPALRWLDLDIWTDKDPLEVAWSSRKCPKCDTNMATISYESTGETIDYCVDGHGVWLDKGEFENIIEALEEEIYTKSVPEYLGAAIEEAKEILTGPEGFVSEWNDFLTVTRLLYLRVLVENPGLTQALEALQSASPFR